MSTTTTFGVDGMTCGHCVQPSPPSCPRCPASRRRHRARRRRLVDRDRDVRRAARRGRRRTGRSTRRVRGHAPEVAAVTTERTRRPRDRGHDLRVVRRPRREAARPSARRLGDRQPSARVGARRGSPARRGRAAADADALVAAVRAAGLRRDRHRRLDRGTGHRRPTPTPVTTRPRAHRRHEMSGTAWTRRARAVRPRDGAGPRHGPRRGHLGTDRRARRRAARPPAVRRRSLTVPVMLLSMIPALQFTGWQWVVAALALPVATWAAWPFHRAASRAARHGASTMDTLVSIGIIAATGWSLWALLFGGAGELGMTMTPSLWPRAAHEGRARAVLRGRRRASPRSCSPGGTRSTVRVDGRATPCARCSTSAPRTSRCSSTAPEQRVPGRARCASATSSSSGPARRSPPTASSSAARARSTRRC